MDYWKAIQELRSEKAKLDEAIRMIENLIAGTVESNGRRGRKGMSAAERKQVSERMRRYWDARRKGITA